MGYFRFRRSIKILPGVRWNIGKKSTSVSFGPRGSKYTIGPQGSRTTVGIPGTGVSYTQVHSFKPGSTTPPPPLPPVSALAQNPAKPRPSRVFYTLGFVMLAIWLLVKLFEQNAPTSPIANPSPSQTPSIAASFAPSVTPVPYYSQRHPYSGTTAVPRALPVETPIPNESSALTQTQSSPDHPTATAQPSATAIPAAVAPTYRVVNVAPRDFLNLRQGPGSTYPLVARISPNARGIKLVSNRFANGSTIWQKIFVAGYTGWVNEIYLKAESAAP